VGKFFFKFFTVFLATTALAIIFLSYFGIETDKFDQLIKSKTNAVNKLVKLDFKNTKIHINLIELNLIVKLQKPKILIKDNVIILSKLNLYLPLKSFITSDFMLKKANIAFEKNDIKDLTKITSIFLPQFLNKKLKKVFNEGYLQGEFLIPFEANGKLGKGYSFIGNVLNASIKLTDDFLLKEITAEINHKKEGDVDVFNININNGYINDLDLADSTINLKRLDGNNKIVSSIRTKGKLNYLQVKKIINLPYLNSNILKNFNGTGDIETKINFDLNKRLKIENLIYSIDGNIDYLELITENINAINVYLPDFDSNIVIKNTKVKLVNTKLDNTTELAGSIRIKNNFDEFKIKNIYNYNKNFFHSSGRFDLTNSKVKLSLLNYNKNYGIKSSVKFDINFVLDKYFDINNFTFLAGNNRIDLTNIKLNKNFGIKDFKKIEIKTFENENKNNDFLIKKSDKIIISGEIFDAQHFLKSLYKKSDKKTFNENFKSEIKINFDNVLTGTNDDVYNFAMIAFINKGSYDKLNLKGNFSDDEIIEMSIYKVDNDKKTLQVISDRARPFVKNFDFIKGFEGGKLEYESTILKSGSISNLLITNFKVSEVPALAQLLTLASLRGIADTLSGEGISFDSFEMKSNTLGNVLNIEDALAMGPAVSILLEGYVDKGKTVSLRGTLVPATKLNSIIASIPIVGDILVGKKTGEGVVGVSFKMKGPPKDIKTTVNPIKTLTPRFILRAIKKLKKEKKVESK